ncbi:recombinase RecT [Streptomyces sp. NBC_00264]|uniref:recombinase RecT n=1 Tax=unclassified Streptomyces TaxID=2593676 RepID=UPI00224E6973|nr:MULTISPECIES: recombinase RecT [unclassified Streptomyces]MCX5158132.1 recombinase RecT [Streptomyces sp. NBC_00305]MCX5216655.1 recombinase RecT [Streptomyces sp. NBC_00264]
MSQISNAIATRDNGPAAQIEAYRDEYAALVPSHVNADQWIRLAVGAIRGNEDLMEAAQNDVGVFLRELKTAARLGLEPGTEQFYLTARKSKAHGYSLIIKGIVGYQGIVELIYRAGAVSTVIVEAVRERDTFRYVPGRDDRPVHEIDWFGADRGPLVGVYAYAVMKDGAVSKVVVLNRQRIAEIRAKSDSKDSKYSPWQTNEESMWLKSAVRQLAKWVPTSAEYMREQLRAQAEVAGELAATPFAADAPPMLQATVLDDADPLDEGPIEGELVD